MRAPLTRSPRRAHRPSRPTTRRSVALLWAASALAVITPSSAAAEVIYYDLPAGVGAGSGIAASPDGTVYFTTNDFSQTSRFGRLVPSQASPGTASGISLFPTPTFSPDQPNGAELRALAFDNTQGRLFFTRSDGLVGKAETSQLVPDSAQGISGFRATVANYGVWGVDVDQTTHEAWFTEYGYSNVETPAGSGYFPGNRVARTNASLGLTEHPNLSVQPPRTTIDSLRYDAKPKGIVADGSGGAWFAQENPGNPGWRIGHALSGGTYQEYQVTPCRPSGPCSGSNTGQGITDVAVAADGTVWFTNELDNTVGQLDPSAQTFTQFSMTSIDPSLSASRPRAIRLAPDGALWVAQSYTTPYVNAQSNALVRVVPNAGPGPLTISATVHKLGANTTLAVAPVAGGDVWFASNTTSNTGRIGRLTAGGSPTPTPSPGATPGAVATPTPQPIAGDPAGPVPTAVPIAGPGSDPVPTPVVVAAVSVGKAEVGKVNLSGDTLSSNQICVGPPADRCSLVYLISTHEYVKGFPGTGSRLAVAPKKKPAKTKPKEVELGKLAFTMNGGETKKVTVKLNAKARKALASQKKIKATLTVTQKNKDGVFVQVKKQPVTFTFKKPAAKKK